MIEIKYLHESVLWAVLYNGHVVNTFKSRADAILWSCGLS